MQAIHRSAKTIRRQIKSTRRWASALFRRGQIDQSTYRDLLARCERANHTGKPVVA
jgi:hypothetical protein